MVSLSSSLFAKVKSTLEKKRQNKVETGEPNMWSLKACFLLVYKLPAEFITT